MREIVIADTNVFILLFRAKILEHVFSKERFHIKIPEKIFEELTKLPHRSRSEYPELAEYIIKARYHKDGVSISLEVTEIEDPRAIAAYCEIESIDDGEACGIALAIQEKSIFVTRDKAAVDEFQNLRIQNGAKCEYCDDFLKKLVSEGSMFHADMKLYEKILKP